MFDMDTEPIEVALTQMHEIVRTLHKGAQSETVLLFNRDGELVCALGELEGLDPTSLATLTGGGERSAGELSARLKGEGLAHQQVGTHRGFHLEVIAERLLLVVVFGARSSRELVEQKMAIARANFDVTFQELLFNVGESGGETPFQPMRPEDIDTLFGQG